MSKKVTHEEFVKNIFKINPNIEILGHYTRSKDNILCKCKVCNHEWNPRANNLRYQGCPACGIINRSNKLRKSPEKFIEQSRTIHGNKYNYDKVQYINDNTKVSITCPIHGEFEQTPSNHLQGKGCIKCRNEYVGQLFKDNLQSFIKKSKLTHGDKYDYSKVNYIKSQEKVCIICQKHGEFWQIPNDHIIGKGCPKCNQSKGERIVEQYLQNNNINYIGQYEINIDKSINPSGIAQIDFYLPDYNTFIEYNGKQHYVPVERFGGLLQLEHQKDRDEFVRNYCKNNNIKLLEIPYSEKDTNIGLIIINFLNE